ncbi:hypothetical protein D5086_005156 [Populus alba]|uniref:Uncharacterized protein n=2 Tax=Populus alba TaxID=43335 RepID=A0ACC4CSX6_POPAL|nr:hypothetical protein D5086_0000305680 [Populus alba]
MLALLFAPLFLLTWLHQSPISHCLQETQQHPQKLISQCDERCGKLRIPFPFHLNTSCASVSNAFRLSCSNSTTLYLDIDSLSYKVLEFFSDGILVDFPGSSTCRQYNDLNSFGLAGNDCFGISVDNVIVAVAPLPAAIPFPITVHGILEMDSQCFPNLDAGGSLLGLFLAVPTLESAGVKLEWAVPKNSSRGVCGDKADIVNATAVDGGIRCKCQDGFVGDGYASGEGCMKSSIKDGEDARGGDRDAKKHRGKMVTILAGVVGPIFIIASLIALFCLLKRPVKADMYDPDHAHLHSTISFRKACRTRLFNYHELENATRGFDGDQKLASSNNSTIYAGVLGDDTHIAVHKVECRDERELTQVLSRVEVLSAVLHRNMARVLGCCINSVYSPLVVYEYPANGTLEEHLHQSGEQKVGLDWYKRLRISAETAGVLAFLQYEIIPPVFHHDLKSGNIFLDADLSVKVAGFKLFTTSLGNDTHSYSNHEGSRIHQSDVYNFGVLLLELITGSKNKELPAVALKKIRSGKLEEIVDPGLHYHEQPPFRRDQIQVIADLATRCLLFGGDGKIGMVEVARELIHIAKESIDGSSKRGRGLEETFSNSSLLQMISMSPDSIYVP